MRPRLSEDDREALLALLDDALRKTDNPAKAWRLGQLRDRLANPSPGRPKAMNMERLSDQFYRKRSPPD